ncbi:hypothetical protein D3C76_1468310 [compost metagenome]
MTGLADELLTHQPDGVHRPLVRQWLFRLVAARRALFDEEALPVSRFNQALGSQRFIGVDHGVFRMAEQAHALAQ